MTKAHGLAVEAFARSLAKSLSIEKIDGLSPSEWIEKRRQGCLDELLMSLEDSDPELAALIQSGVNKVRKPKR